MADTNRTDEFVNRVKEDFTFKDKPSEEQKEAWTWVRICFGEFEYRLFRLFEDSPVKERITQTPEYAIACTRAREAERWANAAIANDWKPELFYRKWKNPTTPEGEHLARTTEYPVQISVESDERQRLCFNVSKASYEIAVSLALMLPHSRALSLCITELQNVRGWYIDAVNNTLVESDDLTPPKSHIQLIT